MSKKDIAAQIVLENPEDIQLEKDIDELEQMPNSKLVTKELLPTRFKDRKMTAASMFWLWGGMSILLTTFTLGANLFPSLGIAQILGAIALGNGIVCIVLALTGDIGVKYGITFSVYLRACYGYFGTNIPAIIRSVPAMFWLGFQSYLGATAINQILILLTNGGWAGTLMHELILLLVFLFVQVWTTARGIHFIDLFEKLVAPVMVALGIYIMWYLLDSFGLSLGAIIATPAGEVAEGMPHYNFGYAVTSATGYWATMSLNILDFTRYYKKKPYQQTWVKRNYKLFISQAFGIILTMLFFALIGAAAALATGLWNPVDVIVGMNAPIVVTIIALIITVFAQWSTNIGANILPPANIWANALAPKINFAKGCYISGIIAFAMCTWIFGEYLITFFAYISAALGSIAGTMIVDFYILRGGKLSIKEFYNLNGQFKYAKNYNPAGFIAYAIGFVAAVLFLDWGFIVSLVVGGISYFLLTRFWAAKKYNQVDIMKRFNIT